MKRPHPATVIASLALVAAVAPPAYAALAKNSVGPAQIQPNAVSGGKVKDGSIGVADLGPQARPAKVVVRGWDYRPNPESIDGSVPMGSLSSDGGGPLKLGSAATLVISGKVFLRAPSAAGISTPNCQLRVDGTPVGNPSYGNFSPSDGASVALHAFAVVAKGTHDVSLDCQGNGNNGGLVDVSVIAVPR